MQLRETFRANVARERRKLGLKQYELARKMGVHASYICDVELGKKVPGIDMIERFADALSLHPASLFTPVPEAVSGL